ncbi:hypothetical protein [Vibrio harveyi]|uniref:hypothetical protein n=1 Tax=Vibrio harveyi TaxID=669 RepID=UPI003CF60C7C
MNLQEHKAQSELAAKTQLKNFLRSKPDIGSSELISLLSHNLSYSKNIAGATTSKELYKVCSEYSLHEYREERPEIENVRQVALGFQRVLERDYNLPSNPKLLNMSNELGKLSGNSRLDERRLIELVHDNLAEIVNHSRCDVTPLKLQGGRDMLIARSVYYCLMISPIALIGGYWMWG